MRIAYVFVLATAGACDPSASAEATGKPAVDSKADDLLRKMSASLAGRAAFQFDTDHTLEAVTKKGQKLQFVARSRVALQRPDKLRSDRIGAFADAALYYDGATITIFGKRANLYATSPAPGNLDDAIDFAREKLDLEAPGADLLYADPYKGLMQDVVSGQYIGNEPMGNIMCHHLAYRARGGTDWQIWIEDSANALPCRYVITSTDEHGSPEFSVAFSNWNLQPQLTAEDFTFTPPPDATKIDFLSQRPQVSARK
jgi:hypothetical protein